MPYVDVHETHTGVVVLARRTGIYGEEAGVAGTEFFRSRPVVPVVDDDQGPTSRPRPGGVGWSPHRSTTCIAVKRQNIAKWPPRRHGGLFGKDMGLADADQKLRHSCPSGQGADEVAAGL